MALMDNILNSTDALHLDKLLQNFEFENKQCVKLIEKENQHIEALNKAIEERKSEIINLRAHINELDDNTKCSHKQFIHNRANCESLRKTTVVLMEHEFTLNKKLNSIVSTSEHDRGEREGVLQHYKNIWDEYESVYRSFPLAIKLHEETHEFAQLSLQIEEDKNQADNLQEKIRQFLGDEDVNFKILSSFMIKIAEMKLEMTKILHEIQTTAKKRADIENFVVTYPDSKNNEEEEEELIEIDCVKDSESQSTMIGMYCNMTDENNEEEDIIALNTNNNKEMNSVSKTGITHTEETVNKQEVSAREDQHNLIGVENQIALPLCSVRPSIQITKPRILHQKMPSQMRVNDAKIGNQFEAQTVCNQQRSLTSFTSQQGSSKMKTQELTQRPLLLIPQQFHPSPVIGKIQTSASVPLVQSVNQTSALSNEITHQMQHKNCNFMPTMLPPISRSNTHKDITLSQLYIVDNNRTEILNDQFSPNKNLNGEKQVNVPQASLSTQQNETECSKPQKTLESEVAAAGGSSESPFDINKHKEHLKQMWKSPNPTPLKGRSMFSEEAKDDDSALSSQFIQPFIQSDNRKSLPKFNTSAFPNVTSHQRFNTSAFPNVSSQATKIGSNFENIGVSCPQDTNYLFQGETADTINTDSSFSFSFDGNDSKAPETSGFTFNFGSPESEESTKFNLF